MLPAAVQDPLVLAPEVQARFYRGLADPARLALLLVLRDGERAVGEAAAAAGIGLSRASRHLACLRECGLVVTRQEWRRVYYRLADGVAPLLERNAAFIATVADQIVACQRPEMDGRP